MMTMNIDQIHEQCQEWLDFALDTLEKMGDKKMSVDNRISHIAVAEDLLRNVKSLIAEWQPKTTSSRIEIFNSGVQHDKDAREQMLREFLENRH